MTQIGNVTGPVLRPGDGGFDEELAGYQAAHPHRPDLVVGATTPDDVEKAVRHAVDHGLSVAVENSGHGRGVPLAGGMLISTRRMDGVQVDPASRTARVQAGTRWAQVVEAAIEHGLAPPSGSSPEAGAVGYTLGGGIGVLARQVGWASDRVRSIDLVTAAGARHVTAESDPELFRVLRGAGAGLGVVTAMEVELAPVTRFHGGSLAVDGPHVPDLLAAYREWAPALPEELTSSVGMLPYPDLPMVPDHLRGRYVAQVRIAYTGSAADGERLVAPLRAAVPQLTGALGEVPYPRAATIFAEPTQPHPYTGTNAMLRELDPAVLGAAMDITGPEAPVMCVLGLRHLGGALARPPAAPDTVPHRDAQYLLQVLSLVDGTDVPTRLHRQLMDAAAPWTLGRTPNFRFGEQAAHDWPIEVPGRADLVAELDPTGIFQS